MSDPSTSLDLDSLPFVDNEGTTENVLSYGGLVLRTASKEGKANLLLADQFFSPSLLLAEQIELGILDFSGLSVLELGAGAALPSLLAATLPHPPSIITITDHPDETIITSLRRNIASNEAHFNPKCNVHCVPYIWGEPPGAVLQPIVNGGSAGYDVMLLSDLLYFDASHKELIKSIELILSRSRKSRAYVAAGTYTHDDVCNNFLNLATGAGLEYKENTESASGGGAVWNGRLPVGLPRDELSARKAQVRWWTLWWNEAELRE